MNIFKRTVARLSPLWARDALAEALQRKNLADVSYYLPHCSPLIQLQALHRSISNGDLSVFYAILPHVSPNNFTFQTAAAQSLTVGTRDGRQYLEALLPQATIEHKIAALETLISRVDTVQELHGPWRDSIELLVRHGVSPEDVCQRALQRNNTAVFVHFFDQLSDTQKTALVDHLTMTKQDQIVEALLPYITPDLATKFLPMAVYRGAFQHFKKLADLCTDHSQALACAIVRFSSVNYYDQELYRKYADMLYPNSDPQKTLEWLYEDHEEFMEHQRSFSNPLLKELHENIAAWNQRSVLAKAVESEPGVGSIRRKM